MENTYKHTHIHSGKTKPEWSWCYCSILSRIIREMYKHNIFSFILTSEKKKNKKPKCPYIGKKKQVEVRNSCKNCWTNSSISLTKVTRRGRFSTFVLHGQLRRKRCENRKMLLAQGEFAVLLLPTSTMGSSANTLLAGPRHHYYAQWCLVNVQRSPTLFTKRDSAARCSFIPLMEHMEKPMHRQNEWPTLGTGGGRGAIASGLPGD